MKPVLDACYGSHNVTPLAGVTPHQTMNRKIYISGPMTGKPDSNIPAFNAAAERLRKDGHFVINPYDLSLIFGTPGEIDESFRDYYAQKDDMVDGNGFKVEGIRVYSKSSILARAVMDANLAAVRSCDAIYLLRGWETSRGAKKELAEAIAHNLTVMLDALKPEKEGDKQKTHTQED